jgi:hypothetical protein
VVGRNFPDEAGQLSDACDLLSIEPGDHITVLEPCGLSWGIPHYFFNHNAPHFSQTQFAEIFARNLGGLDTQVPTVVAK